jgi:hypothetical protein
VQPIGSTEARLHAAAPDVEAGNVVLPHPSIAPWVRRFIDECAAACCGGRHDDAADMMSQAINKLRKSNDGFFNYLLRSQERAADEEAARRASTGVLPAPPAPAPSPVTGVVTIPARPDHDHFGNPTEPPAFSDPLGVLQCTARGV